MRLEGRKRTRRNREHRRKKRMKKDREKWHGVVGPEKDQLLLVPREAFLWSFRVQRLASRTCSWINLPHCSHCQVGAQSLSLMIHSICLGFLARIQVSLKWMQWPKLLLSLSWLIYPYGKTECDDGALQYLSQWNVWFVWHKPCQICKGCHLVFCIYQYLGREVGCLTSSPWCTGCW